MSVFKGYEGARYQQHDSLIRELVIDFNKNKATRCSCTADQSTVIPDLDEDVVKAWMVQESGGGDANSRAAWKVDPVQVNVPGDWSDIKESLGLTKPAHRNTGDIRKNLRAGIILLSRKGFGKSGKSPLDKESAGVFDGWKKALERYNGRTDAGANGTKYSENYAEAIWKRSQNPGTHVPIEI
jgi:hypothetical protein